MKQRHKIFLFLYQLPDDFEVVYSNVEGELVVGGVYLNLFIAQPHWVCIIPSY